MSCLRIVWMILFSSMVYGFSATSALCSEAANELTVFTQSGEKRCPDGRYGLGMTTAQPGGGRAGLLALPWDIWPIVSSFFLNKDAFVSLGGVCRSLNNEIPKQFSHIAPRIGSPYLAAIDSDPLDAADALLNYTHRRLFLHGHSILEKTFGTNTHSLCLEETVAMDIRSKLRAKMGALMNACINHPKSVCYSYLHAVGATLLDDAIGAKQGFAKTKAKLSKLYWQGNPFAAVALGLLESRALGGEKNRSKNRQ